LLAVGMVVCLVFNPAIALEAESLAIHLDAKQYLVARIFTAKSQIPNPTPVMLLCHGINSSKATMTPMAVELARRGIAAIAFDFRGYGESSPLPSHSQTVDALETTTLEDARAILNYVRQHPERFDLQRIGIAGHSLGGMTALQLAQLEPQLRATLVFSMGGSATPTSPANLFLGVGVYEQINPASQLRETLEQATGGDRCNDRDICGDFRNNTARQLFISSTADHITAPYNPQLLQQAASWAQRALDVPGKSFPVVVSWYICGLVVTFWSAIASGVAIFLQTGAPIPENLPQIRRFFRGCVTGLIGILMGVMWIMGSAGTAPSRGASQMMLFAYVLQLCSNYALRYPKKVRAAVGAIGLYAIAVFVAFLLPPLLCCLPEIARQPAYLLDLPKFVLQWPFLSFYNYAAALKLIFFPTHTLALHPSWVFLAAIAIEILFPGTTLTVVERGAVWGITRLRRPFTLTGMGQLSPGKAGLIILLIAIFGVVLYLRLSDGLLEVVFAESLLVLRMVGLFVVLPIAAIVLAVRSPLFQRWERAIIYNSSER
jgi:pimeloyl-ACP methyl ester carboxylesterase